MSLLSWDLEIRDRGAEMWDRQTVDAQRAVLSPAEGQPRAPNAPCVLVLRGLRWAGGVGVGAGAGGGGCH